MRSTPPSGRKASALELKAKLFRGLADRSRLSILETLRDGARNVQQIVAATGLSQPNASMHLGCLWRCGLVDKDVHGRFSFYRIASKSVEAVLAVGGEFLEVAHERIAACDRYCGTAEGNGRAKDEASSAPARTGDVGLCDARSRHLARPHGRRRTAVRRSGAAARVTR